MMNFERGAVRGTVLILIGVVLVAGSLFYLSKGKDDGVAEIVVEAPVLDEASPVVADKIDVEAALAPRILGDKNAPVKIEEFASLTCGHCAKFHTTTLKELKAKYVDNGGAYIQFTDFPLNRPALDGVMLARCLPVDQYVPFTTQLFEEQDNWAFDEGYLSKLKAYATDYGMDDATFKACLASNALKQGIIAKMQAAQKQYDVSSTPTFVVNNSETIVGSQPLSSFEPVITKFSGAAE